MTDLKQPDTVALAEMRHLLKLALRQNDEMLQTILEQARTIRELRIGRPLSPQNSDGI